MRKPLAVILLLLSIGMFGWVGYDYQNSGGALMQVDLAGSHGSLKPIELKPDMGQIRFLLNVSYEIDILEQDVSAYEYEAALSGLRGKIIFREAGSQREKRDDNTPQSENRSVSHVLKTIEVSETGAYELAWTVTPDAARITELSMTLREHVRPFQTGYFIAGLICFGLGFLILRQRRPRSR